MLNTPVPHPAREQQRAPYAAHISLATMQPEHAPDARFLQAWLQAVSAIGVQYFGTGEAIHPASVVSKWALPPRMRTIRRDIRAMEHADKIFLCALVSLYNPQEAMRLRPLAGLTIVMDASSLDPMRRALISELILNGSGW